METFEQKHCAEQDCDRDFSDISELNENAGNTNGENTDNKSGVSHISITSTFGTNPTLNDRENQPEQESSVHFGDSVKPVEACEFAKPCPETNSGSSYRSFEDVTAFHPGMNVDAATGKQTDRNIEDAAADQSGMSVKDATEADSNVEDAIADQSCMSVEDTSANEAGRNVEDATANETGRNIYATAYQSGMSVENATEADSNVEDATACRSSRIVDNVTAADSNVEVTVPMAEADAPSAVSSDLTELTKSSLFSSYNSTAHQDSINESSMNTSTLVASSGLSENQLENSSFQLFLATKIDHEPQDISDIGEDPPVKRMKLEDYDANSDHHTLSSGMPVSMYQFKRRPKQLTGAWTEFESQDQSNYLRGCKWSPDGTCLLTNSNDNVLRVFNLPQEMYVEGGEEQVLNEMSAVLKIKEADTIYDYCWLPTMSSADPDTSCLVVTSRGTPIHMFDAYTGAIRCSYRAYDQMDELIAAYCVSIDPRGEKLYCGFNKMMRVFDITRPGRECISRPTFAKLGQRGIISCVSHSPSDIGLYAAGSYSKSIALYHEPMGEMVCMFEGQQGGVTQVQFSADGSKLYSGGRKDNEILCWDIRNPGQLLYSLIRKVSTNQRIQFDVTRDGQYVVSGCQDGQVLVWDMSQTPVQMAPDVDPVLKPVVSFTPHQDTVNGVSLHPTLPILATASGQRHFQPNFLDSDGEEESEEEIENSLLLWWV